MDTDNFPTDRYVLEGIADERGCVLRWIETDPAAGVTPEQVAAVVGPDTALVLLSHVAYRSGWIADAPAITGIAHDAGALVLWDLSHSVGSVELSLDAWGVDLAVGCTYKYLNGGPGAPAFGYVRRGLQDELRQPIQGWMGRRDPFAMGPGYLPAPGVRALVSGTPPILAMVPLLAEPGPAGAGHDRGGAGQVDGADRLRAGARRRLAGPARACRWSRRATRSAAAGTSRSAGPASAPCSTSCGRAVCSPTTASRTASGSAWPR